MTSFDYKNQFVNQFIVNDLGTSYESYYNFMSMLGNMAPSIAISALGSIPALTAFANIFRTVGFADIALSAAGASKVQGRFTIFKSISCN